MSHSEVMNIYESVSLPPLLINQRHGYKRKIPPKIKETLSPAVLFIWKKRDLVWAGYFFSGDVSIVSLTLDRGLRLVQKALIKYFQLVFLLA